MLELLYEFQTEIGIASGLVGLMAAVVGGMRWVVRQATGQWQNTSDFIGDYRRLKADHERLKRDAAQSDVRLDRVDPERFIDRLSEVDSDLDRIESAEAYLERQNEAILVAARTLLEDRLLATAEPTTEAQVGLRDALARAEPLVNLDIADRRLSALVQDAHRRLEGIAHGEPLEALDWENWPSVELNALSLRYLRSRHYGLAELAARKAVAKVAIELGTTGLPFAHTLAQHAECLRTIGAAAEAIELEQRAMQIFVDGYGPDHLEVGKLTANMAHAYDQIGQFTNAQDAYRKAIDIYQAQLGDDSIETLEVRRAKAVSHRIAGRLESAEVELKKLADAALDDGPEAQIASSIYNSLGYLYMISDRRDEARIWLDRSLETYDTAGGKIDSLISPLRNLADLCETAGDFAAAEGYLTRLLEATKELQGGSGNQVAWTEAALKRIGRELLPATEA